MPAVLPKPRIGVLALTLELYEHLLPALRQSRERWRARVRAAEAVDGRGTL